MVSIQTYLPGIQRGLWGIFTKTIQPPKVIKVPPYAENYGILPSDLTGQMGIFTNFTVEVNNPALIFNVTIDDISISQNITGLYEAGYNGYFVASLPWLSKYDTSANIYVANVVTEVPFQQNLTASVTNPTSSEIEISGMEINAFIFHKGFYEALRKLQYG